MTTSMWKDSWQLEDLYVKPPVTRMEQEQEREFRDILNRKAEGAAQRSAGLSAGFRPDDPGAYFQDVYKIGQANRMSHDEIMGFMDEINQYNIDFAQGSAVGVGTGIIDLGYLGATVLSNLGKAVQGQDMEWPEDMRDMPASSDWWLEQLGISREDTSLATFVGMAAISPSRLANMDAKVVGRLFKTIKALGKGGKSGVDNLARATSMWEAGYADPMTIWKETGWMATPKANGNGVDWKFVLSDAKARVRMGDIENNVVAQLKKWQDKHQANPAYANKSLLEYVTDTYGSPTLRMKLGDVMEHNELYELYPGLKNISVDFELDVTDYFARLKPSVSGEQSASYNHIFELITVNGSSGKHDLKQALLHEVQHHIQAVEDWAGKGTNATYGLVVAQEVQNKRLISDILTDPGFVETLEADEIIMRLQHDATPKKYMDAVKKVFRGEDPGQSVIDDIWDDLDRAELRSSNYLAAAKRDMDEAEFIEWLSTKASPEDMFTLAMRRYSRDSGEVEARLTEALMQLSQEELDRLPVDPYQLQWLMKDPETLSILRWMYPKIEEMKGKIKPENIIFTRKDIDTGEEIAFTTKQSIESWDDLTYDERVELAQQALANDPATLVKVLHHMYHPEAGRAAKAPKVDEREYRGLAAAMDEPNPDLPIDRRMEPQSIRMPTNEIDPQYRKYISSDIPGTNLITKADLEGDAYLNTRTKFWMNQGESFEEAQKMAHDDIRRVRENMEATANLKKGKNRIKVESRLHGIGKPKWVDVLKNPTEAELRRWAKMNLVEEDGFSAVRVLTDVQNNLYVWDANIALHNDMIQATGMKINIFDDWTDVDGLEPEQFDQIFKAEKELNLAAFPPDTDLAPKTPALKKLEELEDALDDMDLKASADIDIYQQAQMEEELMQVFRDNPDLTTELWERYKLSYTYKKTPEGEFLSTPSGMEIRVSK